MFRHGYVLGQMRYYDAEPPLPRAGGLRFIVLGLIIIAASAVVAYFWIPRGDDDTSGSASTDAVTSLVVAPTSAVPEPTATATVVLTPEQAALSTEAATLVEDCVQYVPTAIYFGNVYMKAIWDIGGGTPEGLRQVCERMVVDDLPGLRRMSDELHALQNLAATTTAG